eukprot:gb/GECG01013924.1/.p1 GENE.gb/GECG01013924.1/~~gb/GECG01013924.1/.p1  ORF type:complete len:115 (+),score=18.25 gb/GECG01013924.1/:1-345(+)
MGCYPQVFSYDIRKNPRYEAIVTPILTESDELEEQQKILRKQMADLLSADIKKIMDIAESKNCCARKLYYLRSGIRSVQSRTRVQPLDEDTSGRAKASDGETKESTEQTEEYTV